MLLPSLPHLGVPMCWSIDSVYRPIPIKAPAITSRSLNIGKTYSVVTAPSKKLSRAVTDKLPEKLYSVSPLASLPKAGF